MRSSRLVFFISSIILLLFFVIKAILFYKLEYQNDLMSCLQLSRDWLFGKPYLFENGYGNNFRIHNYVFVTLLFPLTVPLGAYGLFLGLMVFYFLSFYATSKALKFSSESIQTLFIVGVLSGPVTFWLIDDGHFGFNCELFFFPLSLLLASALIGANRWLILLTSLFIVLVREDGILLVASIYLFFKSETIDNKGGARVDIFYVLRTNFKFVLFTIFVFVAGIYIQHLNIQEGRSRFSYIPENILTVGIPGTFRYLASEVLRALGLLCVPIVFLFFLGLQRRIVWIFFYSLPLFAIGLVSSLYYFSWGVGLSWSVRMAYIYGFFCAASIIIISRSEIVRFSVRTTSILLFVLFCLGGIVLKSARNYPVSRMYHALFSPSFKHSSSNLQLHHQLASRFENGTTIRVPFKYFDAYHRQDLVWPGSMQNAWKKPYVLVFEKQNDDFPDDLHLYKSWHPEALDSIDLNTVWVYFPAHDIALKERILGN